MPYLMHHGTEAKFKPHFLMRLQVRKFLAGDVDMASGIGNIIAGQCGV
jgi:hypothetical protein